MLERGFRAPLTSSFGRLFDAVACLVGLRDRVSHEGQAAQELEWRATDVAADGCYPFEVDDAVETLVLDPRPMIREIVRDRERGTSAAVMARRFHTTCTEMLLNVCRNVRRVAGLERVVLSGGVFLNALLTAETVGRLEADGFAVYRHRLVPPGDGGLSLGQLAIAAHCGPAMELYARETS